MGVVRVDICAYSRVAQREAAQGDVTDSHQGSGRTYHFATCRSCARWLSYVSFCSFPPALYSDVTCSRAWRDDGAGSWMYAYVPESWCSREWKRLQTHIVVELDSTCAGEHEKKGKFAARLSGFNEPPVVQRRTRRCPRQDHRVSSLGRTSELGCCSPLFPRQPGLSDMTSILQYEHVLVLQSDK